jgi:hypothetical protein
MEQYQMTDYRIVHNAQTGRYRIEQRRWWGWDFVLDPTGTHYVTFESLDEARGFACRALAGKPPANRRWKVISPCCEPPAA